MRSVQRARVRCGRVGRGSHVQVPFQLASFDNVDEGPSFVENLLVEKGRVQGKRVQNQSSDGTPSDFAEGAVVLEDQVPVNVEDALHVAEQLQLEVLRPETGSLGLDGQSEQVQPLEQAPLVLHRQNRLATRGDLGKEFHDLQARLGEDSTRRVVEVDVEVVVDFGRDW